MPAPSSSAMLRPLPVLYFNPGAIRGKSVVRGPMYFVSISRLPSKPPDASITFFPRTS